MGASHMCDVISVAVAEGRRSLDNALDGDIVMAFTAGLLQDILHILGGGDGAAVVDEDLDDFAGFLGVLITDAC